MGDILFLAHRTPFPPDRGDKIRGYHILKHLAARARVHLIAFAEDERDLAVPDDLLASATILPRAKPMWRAGLEALAAGKPVSLTAFEDAALAEAVRIVLARQPIETIWCFSSQMAQYLPVATEHRLIMDFCDVDSAKFAQYGREGSGPKALMMRREGRLLLAHDRAVAERVDASLFVSAAEAALFKELTGAPRVRALPNGIDTIRFDPATDFTAVDAGPGPLAVFTGQMDYAPNVAAVDWFARETLPLIRRQHPAARFAIVGRAPTAEVQALADLPGVTVTGEVADVRGWLAAADVVVAPLKLARGVQNKVLEAMAMARPVVASGAAAEGIDHGGTIRVGADAAAIAGAVSELIADPVAADALGQAARARAIAHYGWDAALAPIDTLLSDNPVRPEPVEGRVKDADPCFDKLSTNGSITRGQAA